MGAEGQAAQAGHQGRVISALGLVQILNWGSSYYLMAVLAQPIIAETGWPLPVVVGALSVALVAAALVSPLTGRLIARHGGRPVLAAASVLLAAGLAVSAMASTLWAFYLGWAIIGLGMGAGLYDPVFATLGRLYRADARRAITTLTLWGGFASTVCWPLSTALLDGLGWRGTALAYAGLHLLLSLPLTLFAVPKEPQSPRGPTQSADNLPLTAPERRAFCLMAAILVSMGLAVTMISVHLLSLLQSQGLSFAEAVALGAMIGPAQVAGRLVDMAGRGRHHPIWSLLFSCGAVALGLVLLAMNLPMPALAMILYGAGNGVFSIARGALPLAMFGPARYPALMGRLARPALLAQAAAPVLGGALISRFGPASTWAVIAALGVLCFAFALWLKAWRTESVAAG
ncbi:MFS transporter [Paracoccus aminophilus]|uniref:Major facilitator superfamily MFS-1 n=1 Tax=Paracoccus aminophilus JCM 7686 TaxID=1367847 RepID=S5YIE2_PARAH|nr:MFS transporter [Paracoccus aminophilus]AGT11248.1 major facilitator superfamily MFS-1 [Paracoccus aminophilus JCM 7686]